MHSPFSGTSRIPTSALVTSLTVFEPPVVTAKPLEHRTFVVSDGRALISASGSDFNGETVAGDVIGTFRYRVEATVVGDEVMVQIGK